MNYKVRQGNFIYTTSAKQVPVILTVRDADETMDTVPDEGWTVRATLSTNLG